MDAYSLFITIFLNNMKRNFLFDRYRLRGRTPLQHLIHIQTIVHYGGQKGLGMRKYDRYN